MDFIPLHLHSCFTFLKSGILLEKLFLNAKEKGYSTLGLTDVNTMYGYPSFYHLSKKNNFNCIFGLDFEFNEYYLTFFVKDEIGYQNLCEISLFLEKKDDISRFFEIFKDKLKGIICVISTKLSKIFNHVNENLFKINLTKLKTYFDDFYIGLEIYNPLDKPKSNLIREFANQYNINCLAFPLIKYLDKKDYQTLAILEAINEDTNIETVIDSIPREYYLRTKEEINNLYSQKDILETNNLFHKINFEFMKKRGNLLNFTKNQDIDSKTLLKENILKGLSKHNIDLNNNKNYRSRLNKEFLIIDKMGYCDYFLIVQDYCKYARDNFIPIGPGRGSAAGSLIAYLLDITEVDPLKYSNLIFERFLNPERKSMPDIDIDFSDKKRDDVIEYIIRKYGQEKTARVIAFQTIKAKQALRDVGRVFKYSSHDIDQLSKAIPKGFRQEKYTLEMCKNEIPAFKELINDSINAEIVAKAQLIEGFPRQKGLHAAGVIINDESLLNLTPLTLLDENTYITQFEKDYLEEQGFLKMDLLGLTALSTIERTLELINFYQNINLNISNIPIDDIEALKMIREGKTIGIFQLDTGAASKGISYIEPTSFNDIVDLLALDRPGPMEQIPLYSDIKKGRKKISYLDNTLIPILKDTNGIIIYQEQIMQIATIFAGFAPSEADIFRRAVSKKHKDELLENKEKFFKGALKLGHKKEQIEKIFNLIEKFASYGFNKSHSVAYSMISMKMAYLKAHYPKEFYCAIL